MVKRTLPNMAILTWESQQAKQMRGKLVGIVKITHSVKTAMCTTSPWAQGPICNVIANAALAARVCEQCRRAGSASNKG